MQDAELIEYIRMNAVKDIDIAMRQIYKECYPATERLVLKNNGNVEDAKDLFQETMVFFYYKVKAEDFVLSSKISTFIYSISKNQWHKRLRDLKKSRSLATSEYLQLASEDEYAQDDQEYSEGQLALSELLEKSGQKCVRLLKLFYVEKLSMIKIAQEFDYASEQVAKNKKARCLKKIRASMLQNKEYHQRLKNMI